MAALDPFFDEARALENAGNLAGAVTALERVRPEERQTGMWNYARGALAARQGEMTVAARYFEKAIAAAPEIGEYRANLGAALLEQVKAGQSALLPQAIQVLEEAVRCVPKLPSAFNNLGLAYLMGQRAHDAVLCFDASLAIEPRHIPTLFNKAAALNVLDEPKRCLQILDEILAIDPAFQPAITSRQNALNKLK